jgi:hypothetical protein
VNPGDHVVQFYDGDDELTAGVCGYLGEGLQAGDAVIVIATAAHRSAVEARLAQAGADVAAAKAAGCFAALDAAETMQLFLTGDRPDPGGFRSAVGALMRQQAGAGRAVRVYAEMVALLWEAGQIAAAIELEALWNDLRGHFLFSLWCAYPAQLVAAGSDADALHEVCRLHSAVVGSAPPAAGPGTSDGHQIEAARSFPNALESARAARHFVLGTLRSWGDQSHARDAAIITAELAANAVMHTCSAFTVAISRAVAGVRISVRDASPLPSAHGDSTLAARRDHGLGVVAAIATRWAVEPLPDGKIVWAELPA